MDRPLPSQHFAHFSVDRYMRSLGHTVHIHQILQNLHPGLKDQQMVTIRQDNVDYYHHEMLGGAARFSEQEIAYMQSLIHEFGDDVCILYDN